MNNNVFIQKLTDIAAKVSQNRIINTISHALMSLMPVLMIGSLGSLFQQIPFAGYQSFISNTGLMNLFKSMVNMTTNMMGVYTAFAIAYTYAKEDGKDGFVSGLIAMISYLLITPTVTEAGELMETVTLPMTWLGSTGLFTGMILSLLSAKMYCWFVNKNITIKLPDSVPPFIGKSFAGIIPGIAIALVWGLVNLVVGLTPFGSLHTVIYGFIAAPLQNLGMSIWAVLLALVLTGLCWFLGIHGMAIAMVTAPLWMGADAANISAISAGGQPQLILTNTWIQAVSNIGGAGCTIGLVLLMLFRAKSKQYKDLGKLTIAPSLFGINEPVTYGVPCMLNPILAIPYIFLPAAFTLISYILVKIGILPVGNGVGAPVAMPIVSGFFNMGWRGALWNIVEIVLSVLVYLPFFKIIDNKAAEMEKGSSVES